MREIVAIASLALILTACAASGEQEPGQAEYAPDYWAGWYGEGGEDAYVSAAADSGYYYYEDYKPPAPEQEVELELNPPCASENFVYVVATDRDSVVKIDSKTLKVTVIQVGRFPTKLVTLPHKDVAVVINSGTDDISIIRSTEDKDEVTFVTCLEHINDLAVSPDGTFVFAFYNPFKAKPDDPVGDLQTVCLLKITDNAVKTMLVSTGFAPSEVFFGTSTNMAFILTEDGLCPVDLEKVKDGYVTTIYPVTTDPFEKVQDREVLADVDSGFAVVRQINKPVVRVVDLTEGKLYEIQIPGIATDLDLIPGSTKSLLVLREQGIAIVLDAHKVIEGNLDEAGEIVDLQDTGAGAAVVSPAGDMALLFSLVEKKHSIAVLKLDVAGYPLQVYALEKAPVAVALSDQGRTAVILHEVETPPENATNLEKIVAQSNGFTLLNLYTGYAKLVQTEGKWKSVLFVPGPESVDRKLFVLTDVVGQERGNVYALDLASYLATVIPLASKPEAMVYVKGADKIAVSQVHPNGQLTFIDVDTATSETVSGYELNGLIH